MAESSIIARDLDLGFCGQCGSFVTLVEYGADLFCKTCLDVFPASAEPIR